MTITNLYLCDFDLERYQLITLVFAAQGELLQVSFVNYSLL
jgi:hypothetical protein